MLQYIGDSSKIKNRVRQHCTGNVESSALRKTIAEEMGFEIVSVKRPSGSRKKTVNPLSAEKLISDYIQSGNWKVVSCQTVEEARDFQWYGIDKMRPPLNKYMQFWDLNNESTYQALLDEMLDSEFIESTSTLNFTNEPGVYSLWHENSPVDFVEKVRND